MSDEFVGLRLLAALPVVLHDSAHCISATFARFFHELRIGLFGHALWASGLAIGAGWRAFGHGELTTREER